MNAQGGQYGNALLAACFGGNKEIVQLLFDRGADVNTQGGQYGNALQVASLGRNKEIVVTLLLEWRPKVVTKAHGALYQHTTRNGSA